MSARKKESAEPVATVAKALAALRAFVDGQDEWGVRELATALDMPPSTVHRLLARLRIEGFIGFDAAHQKYTVGFEFARLAAAVTQRHGLRQAALPLMRELTERTGESVWLAIYDDERDRIAYVADSESPNASRHIAPLGRVKSMIDSACGIAILAGLPAAARKRAARAARGRGADVEQAIAAAAANGYAVMRATDLGAAMMVAAAVGDAAGHPMGSLGIVVPMHRFGQGQERLLGELVQESARRLSSRLGARLLGGASAGSWQEAVGLISSVLRESHPGTPIMPAMGRGGRNLDDVDRGLAAYALTVASSLYDARHGRGQFESPHDQLRTVMHLSELHLLIVVRRDADIREIGELARLRVSPGEQGFSAEQIFRDLLRCATAGDTARRRRRGAGALLYLDYPEGRRQLEAGSVDALVWMSTAANPLIRELERSGCARLAGIDLRTLGEMLRLNPAYRPGVIAREAFAHWLEADVVTVAVPTVLVCRADRPEDEVRDFARTIFEKRATLAQMSSAFERLDERFVLDGLAAPLHAGAQRYFRSQGIVPTYVGRPADVAPHDHA
ncbi:MAG TPA: TAXI family TRAP transporter solute-binding subunit [Burkholderiaceae bacterium]|nr:TAXI family TRAP transporter solute-binding subunit [Burkholderiaceae bacterium]